MNDYDLTTLNSAVRARRLPILVADDDDEDCVLLQQAFSRSGLDVDLHFVSDGQALLDYLRCEGAREHERPRDMPLPSIILLDLNMPRKNGNSALEEIRADDRLRRMPVIIFTTSAAKEDVDRSYDLGANSFITKPSRFDDLVKVVQALNEYWLDTVTVCGTERLRK